MVKKKFEYYFFMSVKFEISGEKVTLTLSDYPIRTSDIS